MEREVSNFSAIRIGLASPEEILSWSYGEVTKPETINYRTLKPEKDGLFCERIFGPTKDFECYCGKYKKMRFKGVICDRCGVEVTRSKVRRERMGHINLAAPVAHIWFVKEMPNAIALLLDITSRNLERVTYFAQHIIISVDEARRQEQISEIMEKMKEIGEEEANGNPPLLRELDEQIAELENIRPLTLLTENRYQELKEKFGDIFEADIGAEAILKLLKKLDLEKLHHELRQEIETSSGQRRKRAIKRLRIVEAFRKSGNKPEWMILEVVPFLPPDLRPMVQLDGGRFATTEINDLYRRVINRNNRLKRLLEYSAPEMILRNEKRMLQQAVDSLFDNEKQKKAVLSAKHRPLKSRSDVLRGKQGRFRRNLLGKRVDYSGRSVIIVEPELKLHQCGLPKRMALELFKPYVLARLVQKGIATNIKSAKRMVERAKPEVWEILAEVVSQRMVLLNRAPTLHRLSIQAFEPVLTDSNAIQLNPLVCAAFNADFDGDQMAVHVPLSKLAEREAREVMLSIHNMLLPSNGEPIAIPTLDIVLGCYYLTLIRPGTKGEGKKFHSFEEAKLAYELGEVELGAEIEVREPAGADSQVYPLKRIKTTVGRIIFNEALPEEFRFQNKVMDKSSLKQLFAQSIKQLGDYQTAAMADAIKSLGFHYATKSGVSIALNDIKPPGEREKILAEAEERVLQINWQYNQGLITEDERYDSIIRIWSEATDRITEVLSQSLDRNGSIYMMSTSGAKGNITQIRQMAGMRGLMTDPAGKIIEFPIKSGFYDGLSMMEYFISTHGGRKGLADTALRTSDAGYLTRRLADVAQDVITFEKDCGTTDGIWITEPKENFLPLFSERIVWRLAQAKITNPTTGEIIVERNEEIDEEKAAKIIQAGISRVYVRSPLSCQAKLGVCQYCYGQELARRRLVSKNTAVGIIAAQSIGEPGTQLTLRTFHTGGVVGVDITSGLPRVEELFEAMIPKAPAILSEIDGIVEEISQLDDGSSRVKISHTELYRDEYPLPPSSEILVKEGETVDIGTALVRQISSQGDESSLPTPSITARLPGKVTIDKDRFFIDCQKTETEEYLVPVILSLKISAEDKIKAGEPITTGQINPHAILRIKGRKAAERYLCDEVQKVYRSQGVAISDKHIEVIIRQMLLRVQVDSPGDTGLLPGELIKRFKFEAVNAKTIAEGGEPATAKPVLLGITRAALNTESFLSAASFQETTRVLAEAALQGKVDHLVGLKENVIIGRAIPARCLAEEIGEIEAKPPELPAG